MKYRTKPCIATNVDKENFGRHAWVVQKRNFFFWVTLHGILYYSEDVANEAIKHLSNERPKSR